MNEVTVTFKLEADDPEDRTGVTEETYNEITEKIMELGGTDIDFKLEG